MKALLRKIIMFLGTLMFLLLIFGTGLFVYLRLTAEGVPEKTILEVNFERNYEEYLPQDPWGRLFMGEAPVIRQVVEGILKAAEDDRVKVLIAKTGVSGMEMGKIQEIRDAIMTFRKSGKKAIAFAESFGEFGAGNGAYYLASAFDKIFLQPSGDIGLTGLSMKTPFLRDFLEKIGVEPQLAYRQEYKTAVYTLTKEKYTKPHLEADRALLESLASQIVRGIVAGRGLDSAKVEELIKRGPFSSKESLQENLIDGIAYRDQVYKEAEAEAGPNSRLLYLSQYLQRAGSPFSGKKKIAVIYGVGPIVRGTSKYSPLGRNIMGSGTVSSAFRAAVRDKSVEAIIFRINSPGGSYVASDTIWRETVRAKQAGKPVIVSMSEVAASGGYFVAMAADKIIAHPGTITGSIGVFGGKMVTSDMWEKIGIRWGEIFTHKNAALWSSTEKYTPEQWKRIQKWMDIIYHDFLTKAAEGRKMDFESVHRAAKGRVWSGEEAKKLGLVDELGGFGDAVREAKALAGIRDEEEVGLKIFPARAPFWKILWAGGPENSEETYGSIKTIREYFEPWLSWAAKLGIFRPSGVLTMEEKTIE